jgi:hypothetical protein
VLTLVAHKPDLTLAEIRGELRVCSQAGRAGRC